jgi:hypothetical protein
MLSDPEYCQIPSVCGFLFHKHGEKVMKKIVFVCAALIIMLGGLIVQFQQPVPMVRAQSDLPPVSGQIQGKQGTASRSGQVQMTLLSQPPVPSAEQLKAWNAQSKRQAAMPPLPEGTTAVTRADSVVDPASQVAALPSDAAVDSPGTFTIFRNTILSRTLWYAAEWSSPTVVNSGPYVFMTFNWSAAISQDGGHTFQYVNPATMFPASYGGFCCNQVAVYDPARDLFIWYLEYNTTTPPGTTYNLFRIAVARPADAVKGTWYYYDIDSLDNTWWNYPDVALSNDYLWVIVNRVPYGSSTIDDAYVFKIPLDILMTYSPLTYSVWDLGGGGIYNYSLRMARGARDTMYLASHNTTSQIRIFSNAENSGILNYTNVNLSATWYNSPTHNCTSPDGQNLCGADDGRVQTGWVSNGKVGFMWGAGQGGGFTYPYVEAVQVRQSDLSYLDRPYMWSASIGFAYPAAAPNARGDLGVAVFSSGGGSAPYFVVSIADDVTRDSGAPWDMTYMRSGYGPYNNHGGDYLSVQPFNPSGLVWVASGFTLQGGFANGYSEPQYTVFGRERDLRSVQLYMDARYATFIPMLKAP